MPHIWGGKVRSYGGRTEADRTMGPEAAGTKELILKVSLAAYADRLLHAWAALSKAFATSALLA